MKLFWAYTLVSLACVGTAVYHAKQPSLPSCAYQWSE